MFRRNHERPKARWDFINNFLHVAYIAGHDHPPILHATTAIKQTTKATYVSRPLSFHAQGTPQHRCRRAGPQHLKAGGLPHAHPGWAPGENRGKYIYPGSCNFTHTCAVCKRSHPAKDCLRLPQDSPYQGLPLAATRLSLPSHVT